MIAPKDWSTMKKLMFLQQTGGGSVVIEDTVSGNPVVFTTDLAKPLRRLSLSLLPRQSGTGDPSPSNIRPLLPWGEVGTWTGGKNLYPIAIGEDTFINNGSATHSNNDGALVIVTDANNSASGIYLNSSSEMSKLLSAIQTPFTVSFDIVASASGAVRVIACGVSNVETVGTTKIRVVRTVTEKTIVNFNVYGVKNGATLTVTNLQIESGSSATAYEPATITPHPVNLQANLLDSSKTSVYGSDSAHYGLHVTFNDGVVTVSGTSTNSGSNVSFNMLQYADASLSGKGYKVQVFDVVGTPVKNIYGLRFDNELAIAIAFDCSSSTEVNTTFKISVSEETLPSYQPYLPTVYGASLDLTTGEVWGTHGLGTIPTISNFSTSGGHKYTSFQVSGMESASIRVGDIICEVLKYNGALGDYFTIYHQSAFCAIGVPDDYTVEEYNQAIAGENIVYPLATPVLLATLTPQQISALVGVNTVWSDADGVEVTYLKKG